ncbi:hypothetical protein MBLNU459_g5792t1 [Dothideomycetes sp. NU459]
MWWSNSDQRRQHKEAIKDKIKEAQTVKKSTQALTTSTPPSLCHSIPTSETYSDSKPQSRSESVCTPFASDCGFSQIPSEGYFSLAPPPEHLVSHPQYPLFSPYEVDIKTERIIFMDDVPTRRDSTISTFSTFQPPPTTNGLAAIPAESWVQQEHFEMHRESFAEEPVDFDFFELPYGGQVTPTHEAIIDVEESDRPLLDHFIDQVSKLIFPILGANQHSGRADVILQPLESNRCYLHCCLSVAGIHKKATQNLSGEHIDSEIMRHRYATISELCEALNQDTNHEQILEATLGMIFFQCSVGRPDDALPDIPWHQHFQAATSLVTKLELPEMMVSLMQNGLPNHPSFNMTLTAWIDILGSTMRGQSPAFADTYRELNIGKTGAGLVELMGCDDHIMFLISEIACLEARRMEGMEEVMLCKYIEILGTEIGLHEPAPGAIQSAISASGAIRPKQLSINITAAFRIAARIYLCSMVPGFSIGSPSVQNLVAAFSDIMEYIPAGETGFDRSLIWPLLIAGSVSLPGSQFRTMFAERCGRLGEAANFGSFGRMSEIFKDLWKINDVDMANRGCQSIHWRDVMQQKGWDALLI